MTGSMTGSMILFDLTQLLKLILYGNYKNQLRNKIRCLDFGPMIRDSSLHSSGYIDARTETKFSWSGSVR